MIGQWLWAITSLFITASDADVVLLENGGKMSGTIIQMRFNRGEETTTFDPEKLEEVSTISISTLRDTLTVDDDKWEGRIVDVKMKTIGGTMTFVRSKLRGVEKKMSAREKSLAMYRKKVAALEDDNAIGWFNLAVWAGRNRLLRQEREAATCSLEIDPEHAKHAAAHLILGHVLRDGQWLTAREVKELDELAEAQKLEEMKAKGLTKLGNRWVSQEEKDKVEGLSARVDEIVADLYAEAEEWANDKVQIVRREIEEAQRQASNTSENYERAKQSKAEHADHGGCTSYNEAVENMKRFKKQLSKEQNTVRTASNKVRNATTALRTKVAGLKRDIKNESIRLMRKIEAGEEVDEFKISDMLRPKGLE